MTAPSTIVLKRELDVDMSGNRAALYRLGQMNTFLEIAREVDDGWIELEAHSARLDGQAFTLVAVPDRTEFARRLVDNPDATAIDVAAEAVSASAAYARDVAALEILRSAVNTLSIRALEWVGDHQAEFCAAIQKRRVTMHRQLRELMRGPLGSIHAERDFRKNPDAAASLPDALAILEVWESLALTHRLLIGESEATAAEKLWPAITWASNPTEAPSFFDSADDIGKIRTIAHVTPWTPTYPEIVQRARDLKAAAYEEAEKARVPETKHVDLMHKRILNPVDVHPITGQKIAS